MLRSKLARRGLWLLAIVFLLLRFVHLTADYPRNIRWDDGIVTDEGWYASAAINEHTWGKPLLQGDMNIPVIMPVWSLVAEGAFRVLGFGAVALRITAILFFVLCTGLLCVLLRRYGARDWVPLFAAMMMMNPWAFAFSRAGFLEFPMLCFCLLAIVLVPGGEIRASKRWFLYMFAGVSFALALLLKTTAIALSPVLLYVVLERDAFALVPALRDGAILLCTTGVVYGAYWLRVVQPRIVDVRFYLSVVKNTLRFTPYGFIADVSRPFRYGFGSDHLLFSLSLLATAASLLSRRCRFLWKDPVFALAGVWLISFLGFMVKHNNDPARYFAITIPASLLVAIALLRTVDSVRPRSSGWLLVAIAADMAVNGAQISSSLLHPCYSFHTATSEIAEVIRKDDAEPVVIGDQMHEVALHDGLRPVNLLFHSDPITEQMRRYKPGWWLQFVPIDDGSCFQEVLRQSYRAEFRQQWEIFYPGQKLVLWKLTPVAGATLPSQLTKSQVAACSPPVYN